MGLSKKAKRRRIRCKEDIGRGSFPARVYHFYTRPKTGERTESNEGTQGNLQASIDTGSLHLGGHRPQLSTRERLVWQPCPKGTEACKIAATKNGLVHVGQAKTVPEEKKGKQVKGWVV